MSSAALITFSVSRCKLIGKSTSKKSGVTLTSALRNAESNVPSAWAHIITDKPLDVSDVLFVGDSADTGSAKWMQ